ncbi:MAG: peptidoglycan-binding domain-containing protein [Rhizobiaceae bacterium]
MRNLAFAAFSTIHRYPSIAAGSCAFTVAFALVAGNALYAQPGSHPFPLWATRDAVTTKSISRLITQGQLNAGRMSPGILPTAVPVPTQRPVAAQNVVPDRIQRDAEIALLKDVQNGLKVAGHYTGTVDGLFGPQTRSAIIAFQKKNGFEQTGQSSHALLGAILQRNGASTESATVAAAPKARPLSDTSAIPVVENAALTSAPAAVPSNAHETAQEILKQAVIARVQIGLINFGENEVAIDGVLGPQTVAAIKRFQQRYGLQTNGEPDMALIRKLEEVGALQKS